MQSFRAAKLAAKLAALAAARTAHHTAAVAELAVKSGSTAGQASHRPETLGSKLQQQQQQDTQQQGQRLSFQRPHQVQRSLDADSIARPSFHAPPVSQRSTTEHTHLLPEEQRPPPLLPLLLMLVVRGMYLGWCECIIAGAVEVSPWSGRSARRLRLVW
jgi:hypothetical protein